MYYLLNTCYLVFISDMLLRMMMTGLKIEKDIRIIINEFVDFAESYNLKVKGYTTHSYNLYKGSLPERRKEIYSEISEFVDSYLSLEVEALEDVSDNMRLSISHLKEFCNKKDYLINDKFLNIIEEGDVIEVYNLSSNMQEYCNMVFLTRCSYDMLTLRLHEWKQLFSRDESLVSGIATSLAEAKVSDEVIQRWQVPSHDLIEILNPRRYQARLSLLHLSPLRCKKTNKNVAIVSRAKVTSLGPTDAPNLHVLRPEDA